MLSELSFELTIYHLFSPELTSDPTLKNLFETSELDEFWLKIENQYSELSKKAINKLLQFSTTYLCETAFSTLTLIKTKQRNRLDAGKATILAISGIEPRFKELSKTGHERKHTFKWLI